MRIRKNARLSPLLFSHGGSAPLETAFQTHVCQLNQSPWDVIPFGSDSTQLEAEDSFTANNASLGDSIGAVESVASMMDNDEKKAMPRIEDMVINDNDTPPPPLFSKDKCQVQKSTVSHKGDKHNRRFSCQKTDGKGWQCKNEAKPGQSFCDHHYAMLKSYSNSNNNNGYLSKKSASSATATPTSARRTCGRASAKKSSSLNPYEFYYYSGFGPSWGKRRGDRSERNISKVDVGKTDEEVSGDSDAAVEDRDTVRVAATASINHGSNSNTSNPSSSTQIDNDDEFDDYVDDDEEDDANEDISGKKKRMRKPVKARSLKSLM